MRRRNKIGEEPGTPAAELLESASDVIIEAAALITPAHPRGPAVKFPRSSSRSEQFAFAKLLSRVDPHATNGMGFEGIIVRPGATVREASLWPTVQFPKTPILLEYAGKQTIRGQGRERDTREALYILWRFDLDKRIWLEIARAQAEAWEWALDLRPAALRALAESRGGPEVEVLPCLDMIATAIAKFLDAQLVQLSPRDRIRVMGGVMGILHDRVAGQLAQGDL